MSHFDPNAFLLGYDTTKRYAHLMCPTVACVFAAGLHVNAQGLLHLRAKYNTRKCGPHTGARGNGNTFVSRLITMVDLNKGNGNVFAHHFSGRFFLSFLSIGRFIFLPGMDCYLFCNISLRQDYVSIGQRNAILTACFCQI